MKEYVFDEEDKLVVQRIRKCDLAFFYGSTPQCFRKELEPLFITSWHKKYYTCNEVEKIFNHFGYLTRADVESAQERITEYLHGENDRYKQKILEQWQKE